MIASGRCVYFDFEFCDASEYSGRSWVYNSTYSGINYPYLQVGYYAATTTTISYEPVIINISDYYGNITAGLLGSNTPLTDSVTLGKYIFSLFIAIALTVLVLLITQELGPAIVTALGVTFIESTINLLPNIISYIYIIIFAIFLMNEIKNKLAG
jgi:hypothetical protein